MQVCIPSCLAWQAPWPRQQQHCRPEGQSEGPLRHPAARHHTSEAQPCLGAALTHSPAASLPAAAAVTQPTTHVAAVSLDPQSARCLTCAGPISMSGCVLTKTDYCSLSTKINVRMHLDKDSLLSIQLVTPKLVVQQEVIGQIVADCFHMNSTSVQVF